MSNKEQNEKLLNLLVETLQQDQALREQYQVGDKFRFIRDRLNALLGKVQENLTVLQIKIEEQTNRLLEDEVLIYVYLYNAQGMALQSWQKFLKPSVFYEYSVNRPIYTEKADLEAFIRSRPNRVQHGFLTIAVKKDHILNKAEAQDSIGNPLIKVKEGALSINRLFHFTHNGLEYKLDEKGVLVKQQAAE